MAAVLLSACGGGEQAMEQNANPIARSQSSPTDAQGQAESPPKAEETTNASSRVTSAELIGGRPTRPSELLQPGATGSPPPRPERVPQSAAMASLCRAQSWSWGDEAVACQGTAPVTVAGGGQFIVINNQLPDTMGTMWLQCVRNSEGKPTWLPFVMNGNTLESCTVRVVQPLPTDPLEILRRNNCMACHTVDGDAILGPSFRQIADHYRDNPPLAGKLENRIRLGGMGTFGSIPMPSQSQISNDALAIVVPWILSR